MKVLGVAKVLFVGSCVEEGHFVLINFIIIGIRIFIEVGLERKYL